MHTRQQTKWKRAEEVTRRREQLDISKSPLLTGEDPEGAAGLQALMSLRTSLSPMLHAADEAWGRGAGVRRRKLNYHLYQALKKAMYKPAAFFKGLVIPLRAAAMSAAK